MRDQFRRKLTCYTTIFLNIIIVLYLLCESGKHVVGDRCFQQEFVLLQARWIWLAIG